MFVFKFKFFFYVGVEALQQTNVDVRKGGLLAEFSECAVDLTQGKYSDQLIFVVQVFS